ncbi:hypothetical protein U1Q18_030261 [Sarracenia purpurea var. burkii]
MASSSSSLTSSSVLPAFLHNHTRHYIILPSASPNGRRKSSSSSTKTTAIVSAKQAEKGALQYRKLGDSNLQISEITLGTMTFGEQNTEKEAHEILGYAFEHGINALDTAEAISFLQPRNCANLVEISVFLMPIFLP